MLDALLLCIHNRRMVLTIIIFGHKLHTHKNNKAYRVVCIIIIVMRFNGVPYYSIGVVYTRTLCAREYGFSITISIEFQRRAA